MAKDRDLEVDHSSIEQWVVKLTPKLEERFREKIRHVGSSWRMDETYVKVKGKCVVLPEGILKG